MFDRALNTPLLLAVREKCPYSVFYCPYFPAFELNTDQKTPIMDALYAFVTKTKILELFTIALFPSLI